MATTSTNFLIVHGSLSGPEGNWFPWLKNELEKDGHKVAAPRFPTPDQQSFESWKRIADASLANFDPAQTILIGHSTGGGFVFRLAEAASAPYKAVFSVCPFFQDLGLDPYDALNHSFVHHPFDWKRIQKNAPLRFCFAGDDDRYVPLEYVKEASQLTGSSLTILENGAHLNAESGFLEFPLLLSKIRQTVAASSPL